jgi:1,4-dihydroxy-2-naphthoate octaprenyltransferase
MSLVITFAIVALVILLTLALAYLPMRLLLAQMARNIRTFIQRQRERRTVHRGTPDRRSEPL